MLLAACTSNDQQSDPAGTRPDSSAAVQPDDRSPSTFAPLDTIPDDSSTPQEQEPEAATLSDVAEIAGSLVLRDGDGNLVLTAPDGRVRGELASGERRLLTQPTFSRDASRIAWSTLDSAGATLSVAAVDGSTTVTTNLDSPAFYLAWSADDSWLAGLRPTIGSIEFFVAETATAAVRSVGAGQPFYVDWRDDDTLIAAVNSTTLAEIDASGAEEPSTLPIDSPLGLFQAPAVVEADDVPRDRVVVAMLRDGANDVVVLGPDDHASSIGRADGPVSIAVNPVDQRVAVLVLDAAPQSQVISLQIGEPPTLTSGHVSIIDLETGEVTTRVERQIVAMQWSPDGSSLAVLQSTGSALQWLITDVDTVVALTPFVPSQEVANAYLPFADQYNHSTTWWSPDSRAIVMSGFIDGESGVWVDVVDDELSAVRVSAGDLALWSPR